MEMPFGKHKGVEVDKVPADYLKWIWEQWEKEEEADKMNGALGQEIRQAIAAHEQARPTEEEPF